MGTGMWAQEYVHGNVGTGIWAWECGHRNVGTGMWAQECVHGNVGTGWLGVDSNLHHSQDIVVPVTQASYIPVCVFLAGKPVPWSGILCFSC